MKIISGVLATVFIAILLCTPLFSQTNLTGAIVGRAQDSSGAIIPGVEVTIASPSMIGGTRTQVTDEQGAYRFELLSPGTYRVSFGLPGFKTMNIEGVDVTAGITRTIPGTMEVAATGEEVTVTSQAPTIDLEAATVGFNWSQKMIEDLPWSRSLTSISDMIPGARVSSFDIGNSSFGSGSNIASSVGGNNVVIIDGLIWCQTYEDYGSFEEMNITTSMKGADQMGSGITINMAVKSGSNQFHGNFSGSYDNGSMSQSNITPTLLSQGYTPGSSSVTHFRDVYGDIGGPVLKDRVWFYVAYRDAYQGTFVPGFFDVAGGSPAVFWTKLRDPTGKMSYQINSKMKFDASWGLGDKWQPYRGGNSLNPLDSTQDQNAWADQGPVGKFTDIIDSKTTATFQIARGGYWWPAYAYPLNPGQGVQLGLLSGGTQPLPTVNGVTATGTGPIGVRVTDSTTKATDGGYLANYDRPIRWQWNADISHIFNIAGKANEFKGGYFGWWDKDETINFGYPYQELYTYKSLSTDVCPNSNICSNYFLHPNSVTIYDYSNTSATGSGYKGFYLNDKLTANRKLTVNVGLRFDRTTSYEPAQGNNGSMYFTSANKIPRITQVQNPDGSIAVFPIFHQFSPRISFAYDLFGNGKVALKGGYGRYIGMSSSPGSIPGQGAFNPIASRSCTYNNWNGIIPYVPNPGPDGIIGTADDVNLSKACTGGSTTAIRNYAPNLTPSYLDEYEGGIDVGLSRNYALRFNISRKFSIPSQKTINVLTPYSTYTAQTCVPDPGRDGVLSIADGGPTLNPKTGLANNSTDDNPTGPVCTTTVPVANTNFNLTNVLYQDYNRSLHEDESAATYFNLTFNKNYANKWSFVADFGESFSRATSAIPLTPDQMMYNHTGDFPTWNQTFKMNGTYELPKLPLFIGHRSLGGFMWASTFTSQSGAWYGRSAQVTDVRGTTATQLLEGQVGRYPWIFDWDQRISKKFSLGDIQSLEVKWDLFNTMNASTVQTWKSTTSTSSTYLRPDGTPYVPGTILPQRIYEWSASYKF